MKSLNVKKIAAVAAGAAMIGAAFAGAAANVDQTAVGNFWASAFSNGQPDVQIVVGSTAQASDAVVAGNLAALVGNSAFTTGGETATTTTTTTTTAPVAVSVAKPTSVVGPGEYGFTSFFGDDDVDNGADNTYNRTASKPGYNGALAPTKEISSSTTSLMKDGTVDHKGKYSGTITTREYVNLFGSADFITSSDKYIVRTPAAWYSVTYSPGLPACLDSTVAFNACATNNRLDRAGVKLRFLGEDYLVTDVTMSSNVWNSMTLSKASIDQFVDVGKEVTDAAGNKVKVDAISAPQGGSSVSSIGLTVTNAAGATEKVTVTSGASPTKVLSGLYVQVPDSFYVANGVSSARVIFASGSVRMVQNTTIDETIFGKWQVSFTTNNMSSTGSQSISRLQLGNDFQPSTIAAGDSLEIIKGSPGFKWTFVGSNLVAADYTTLTIEPTSLDSIAVNGNATLCSFASVKFTSSRNDAFRFGSDQVATVWWLAKNKTSTGCNIWNGLWLYLNTSSVYAASVGGGGMSLNSSGILQTGFDNGFNTNLTFYYPGTGTDVSVNLVVNTTSGGWQNFSMGGLGTNGVASAVLYAVPAANSTVGNVTYVNVTVPEILNESTATAQAQWSIPLVFGAGSAAGSATATDLGIRDAFGLTTAGKINYSTAGGGDVGLHFVADQAAAFFGDAPLYTPRGSYVSSSPSSTQYVINYASKLGRAQYKLANIVGQTTNASSGATTVQCTPGSTCDLGGDYRITLPSTSVSSGVSQVQLNTATRPLVVLDSQASTTQPLIVVGGPIVNSVAAGMTAGAQVAAASPGDYWVVAEGNKLLVAGYTAQDTVDAGNALADWIANGATAPAEEEAPAANGTA